MGLSEGRQLNNGGVDICMVRERLIMDNGQHAKVACIMGFHRHFVCVAVLIIIFCLPSDK